MRKREFRIPRALSRILSSLFRSWDRGPGTVYNIGCVIRLVQYELPLLSLLRRSPLATIPTLKRTPFGSRLPLHWEMVHFTNHILDKIEGRPDFVLGMIAKPQDIKLGLRIDRRHEHNLVTPFVHIRLINADGINSQCSRLV